MNVRELMAKLAELPSESPVMVYDVESGIQNPARDCYWDHATSTVEIEA